MVEGLYSGLGSGAALSSMQLDVKMKLLVEAPAAVEDALASLLDHHDATLQVATCNPMPPQSAAGLAWDHPALLSCTSTTQGKALCEAPCARNV